MTPQPDSLGFSRPDPSLKLDSKCHTATRPEHLTRPNYNIDPAHSDFLTRPSHSHDLAQSTATGSGLALTQAQQAHQVQVTQMVAQLQALVQQPSGFGLHQPGGSGSAQTALNSLQNTTNICQNAWIIDSGATDQMTWDPTKLQKINYIRDSQHVTVANGAKTKIHGYGSNFRKDDW
ncbi:uncharacterized protein LOC125370608 [Ricinus communis]|uniref:uncharacterized protein LOC125370608 n=1 Tax=Ricinus communis TaxID=3988 RepID=UPI00201A8B5F|nr:uncharacterized protein LOC125370608 [Ricinus communis]